MLAGIEASNSQEEEKKIYCKQSQKHAEAFNLNRKILILLPLSLLR